MAVGTETTEIELDETSESALVSATMIEGIGSIGIDQETGTADESRGM